MARKDSEKSKAYIEKQRLLREQGGDVSEDEEPSPKKPSPNGRNKSRGAEEAQESVFSEIITSIPDGSVDKLTGPDSLMHLWGLACVEYSPCEYQARPCGFPSLFGKCKKGCSLCASKSKILANFSEIKATLKEKASTHWQMKFSA